MVWLIGFFVTLSYLVGSISIFKDKARPSVYSRIIWFLLALNNYLSVVALQNSTGIKILTGLGLIGNVSILLLTLKKSKRIFGKTELVCSVLLATSLIVWATTHLPILNLSIGLLAHYIAGIPTIKSVLREPKNESFYFWFYFFVASCLAFATADKSDIRNYLLPLSFMIFDGLMSLLCLRKKFRSEL